MASQDSVLGLHVPREEAVAVSEPPVSYTYYHAGPLFTVGELTTNVRLSGLILDMSQGKYHPVLPQDVEQRDTTPHAIRDGDLKTLLSCDLALFTYDGTELDSGTVIEYMTAKFADMPAVIVRSDFRGAGDQGEHKGDPWNLMSSNWPRTQGVAMNAMMEYKKAVAESAAKGKTSKTDIIDLVASELLLRETARRIIAAMDAVLAMPARLPKELRESAYHWLALAPHFKEGDDSQNTEEMLKLLHSKEAKGLFK